MATGPQQNRRRGRSARRWRRLVVEQFEPRIVLTDSSGACGLCVLNGLGYFSDNESLTGNELQVTDGLTERRVRDINPGPPTGVGGPLSGAGPMAVANGTLFLSGNDGTHGFELWKSDGTALGTVVVKDINATTISGGSSNPR